ncbi:arsenite efflux ATP-binding protein ArsA [Actinophytocola oryzae]|uniref:Arsenite efflux ATP-binding protein ArsA n=2 Tax=Actinophytocola oryzae TaxID=502181 RepID=A0A4R7UUN2_9PSEU|nr:arsenite efflux ATP-binding protein ArsA [Actinophytocola oryzae]
MLLFTGKGGVGKTTLAAATAARLAVGGHKVFVVSADPAHSLGDVFGVPVSADPSEVDTCLYAAHVDARGLADRSWQAIRREIRGFLPGLSDVDAAELTVLPGVDELLALTEVARLAADGPWEVVVVDCGPTAETLRLLALPEAIGGYLERLSVGRHLADRVGALRDVLVDPARTSVRLVLTPERIVVAETRRTLAALALRGVRVDSLVVNRLVPKAGRWRGPAASWLRVRRAEQEAVLSELDASMTLPLRRVEHRAAEPVGVRSLLGLADELYGETDPLEGAGPYATPLLSVRSAPGGYELTVTLPLTDESTVELARVGDELSVTVDGVRRLVALPVLLRRHEVTDATTGPDGLVVRFEAGGSPA